MKTDFSRFIRLQRKSGDARRLLLQAMMLLDRKYVEGFVIRDFSGKSLEAYEKRVRKNYTDKQENLLCSALQYLTDAFPEKKKQVKKNCIPLLIYLADEAEDAGITPKGFRQWFDFYQKKDALREGGKRFSGSGLTEKQKIDGRLGMMAKSFAAYHQIELPEELMKISKEAEKNLKKVKPFEKGSTPLYNHKGI